MAMMISWVMPVNPSHPYLENDPAPSFAPTICVFHLGFSLVSLRLGDVLGVGTSGPDGVLDPIDHPVPDRSVHVLTVIPLSIVSWGNLG